MLAPRVRLEEFYLGIVVQIIHVFEALRTLKDNIVLNFSQGTDILSVL